jgi:hypothetical protein
VENLSAPGACSGTGYYLPVCTYVADSAAQDTLYCSDHDHGIRCGVRPYDDMDSEEFEGSYLEHFRICGFDDCVCWLEHMRKISFGFLGAGGLRRAMPVLELSFGLEKCKRSSRIFYEQEVRLKWQVLGMNRRRHGRTLFNRTILMGDRL